MARDRRPATKANRFSGGKPQNGVPPGKNQGTLLVPTTYNTTPAPSNRQVPLRARLTTYRGETAVVTLVGVVTARHGDEIIRRVQMLRANDYTEVVLEVRAEIRAGGLKALLDAQDAGARLVFGESISEQGNSKGVRHA